MSTEKMRYATPQLARHGSVAEITKLIQSGSHPGNGPGGTGPPGGGVGGGGGGKPPGTPGKGPKP